MHRYTNVQSLHKRAMPFAHAGPGKGPTEWVHVGPHGTLGPHGAPWALWGPRAPRGGRLWALWALGPSEAAIAADASLPECAARPMSFLIRTRYCAAAKWTTLDKRDLRFAQSHSAAGPYL